MTEGINRSEGGTALAEVEGETLEQLGGRQVQVGGTTRLIGKLDIDQWLALAKAAGKAVLRMDAAEKTALGEAAGTEAGNIAGMLSLFSRDTVLELYSVTVRDPDLERLGRTFDIAEFAEVVDAVDEFNDLRKVIATFQKVAARWRPSSGSSSQS